MKIHSHIHPFYYFFIGRALVFFGASRVHSQTYWDTLSSSAMLLAGCISCAYSGAYFKEIVVALNLRIEKIN